MRRLDRRRGGKTRGGRRRGRLCAGLHGPGPEAAGAVTSWVRVQILAVWREGEHGCNGGERGRWRGPRAARASGERSLSEAGERSV